ncbi:DUF5615 family PIN-like protein [Dyella nitratireducens]|uniref:DUF5615 domain-containing protein n=1 Tax=Dyella nitratireducens TaxID=1849580 RepID=A0ABQ1GC27_9GAMM|nr:DUF5615 family PIN-like protein [Dyella nitratireducens]GGA40871.1 hypothetical protein GCM10010981_32620 [Dyella nitratireducens]GLQ40620.1 hypothetical protein GCM10007902_04690 [Dyella nitratireducens]
MWKDLVAIALEDPCSPKEAAEVLDNLAKKAKARFYADENFPLLAAQVLRKMGGKVKTAAEANMLGFPDEAHAAYALKRKLILVTCDRDFLNQAKFPLIKCPAIFVFNFGGGSEHEIRLAFRCLDAVLKMPQFFDKWWQIDASINEWTELTRHLDGTVSRGRFRVHGGRIEQWLPED